MEIKSSKSSHGILVHGFDLWEKKLIAITYPIQYQQAKQARYRMEDTIGYGQPNYWMTYDIYKNTYWGQQAFEPDMRPENRNYVVDAFRIFQNRDRFYKNYSIKSVKKIVKKDVLGQIESMLKKCDLPLEYLEYYTTKEKKLVVVYSSVLTDEVRVELERQGWVQSAKLYSPEATTIIMTIEN